MLGKSVDLAFRWRVLADITLDAAGKPVFSLIPIDPGVYRLIIDADEPSVYFGEATDLRRRLARYRNPGRQQPTSMRINKLLCRALDNGAHCDVSVAEILSFQTDRHDAQLDLHLKAARVLVESAGIVLARNDGSRPVLNLDPSFDRDFGDR